MNLTLLLLHDFPTVPLYFYFVMILFFFVCLFIWPGKYFALPKEIIKYAFSNYWIRIVLICFIGFGLYALVFFVITTVDDKGLHNLPENYSSVWDPFLSMVGLAITSGLTIYYIRNEWISSLEKKLIVHFVNHKNQYVASCYNVNVLPHSDLRSLGQQVGQQLLHNQSIRFNPSIDNIENKQPILITDHLGNQKWIKYFEIKFKLTDDIKNNAITNYKVWNINANGDHELKTFKLSPTVFHESKQLNIQLLLSTNPESIEKFSKVNGTISTKNNNLEKPIEYIILKKLTPANPSLYGGDIYKIEKFGEENPIN